MNVINSAPAEWYRHHCPCCTLLFRSFKDKARVSGPSQMSRVSAELSLKGTHLIWQSRWHFCSAESSTWATFCHFYCSESRIKWWNDEEKNTKTFKKVQLCVKCIVESWKWKHFLVHVEHFSSPGFQSSSITSGVLRGNQCRQAVIQRHWV